MTNTSSDPILSVAELFSSASVTLGVSRGGSNQKQGVSTRQTFKWLVWAMAIATFFFTSAVTGPAVARVSEQKIRKAKTVQSSKRALARPSSEDRSSTHSGIKQTSSGKPGVLKSHSTRQPMARASAQKSAKPKGAHAATTARSGKGRPSVSHATPNNAKRSHDREKTGSRKTYNATKRS
jgi:hypothetical protein